MIRAFIFVGEFLLATYFVLDVVVPFCRRKPMFSMFRKKGTRK